LFFKLPGGEIVAFSAIACGTCTPAGEDLRIFDPVEACGETST
jgi:hypothetical protein